MFLKKRSIPNILTIFRIALVPIIIVLILVKSSNIYSFTINAQTYYFSLNYVIAGSFFVVACLTDFLDGYLARHNK
jgi:CDP-diacylglycerol--glycerol-3-phosphate 3-phosphatidyltransferase